MSAQLAQRGITGPINFLEGIYGYFHLFAGDKYDSEAVAGDLGQRFELSKTFFKKYLEKQSRLLELKTNTGEKILLLVTDTLFTRSIHGFKGPY